MTASPLLDVRDLGKRYRNGSDALRDLSFSVRAGESLGLIGVNGAGKTTTMRLLAGALLPSSGTVAIEGRALDPDAAALKRRIGFLPAEDALYRHLTALEHLLLSGALYGLDLETASSRAGELVGVLGLAGDEHRRLEEYSTGMRRKVALGCTLIHDPDLILLDEPLESIDIVTASTIRAVLRGLARNGRALVVTSHNLHLVEDLCERIVVLDAGRPVYDGPVSGLVGAGAAAGTPSRLESAVLDLLGKTPPEGELSWHKPQSGLEN